MTNTTHRIRVVLKLPKSNVASLLALARAMVQAFQSNPNLFPQPVPLPAIVQTHVQDLDVAQQATTTRTKGTIATRNAKRALLVSSLEAWRAYVQTLCDANPEQAEALIAAAGMAAAKVPVHAKPVLGARLGALSG